MYIISSFHHSTCLDRALDPLDLHLAQLHRLLQTPKKTLEVHYLPRVLRLDLHPIRYGSISTTISKFWTCEFIIQHPEWRIILHQLRLLRMQTPKEIHDVHNGRVHHWPCLHQRIIAQDLHPLRLVLLEWQHYDNHFKTPDE